MEIHENPTPAGDSWRKLAMDVRDQAATLRDLTADSPLAPQAAELAKNADHLASQVERLAVAAPGFLSRLDPPGGVASTDLVKTTEIEQEVIQIQREAHDGHVELLDIVKALFMWRDDPVERIRERHQSEE